MNKNDDIITSIKITFASAIAAVITLLTIFTINT